MSVFTVGFVLFAIWQIRRGVQRLHRAKRGFDAQIAATKLHLLDPSDQLKVFMTERDALTPTRAFEDAGAEEARGEAKEAAAIEKAIARAWQEKSTSGAPQAMPEIRSFGRRKAG